MTGLFGRGKYINAAIISDRYILFPTNGTPIFDAIQAYVREPVSERLVVLLLSEQQLAELNIQQLTTKLRSVMARDTVITLQVLKPGHAGPAVTVAGLLNDNTHLPKRGVEILFMAGRPSTQTAALGQAAMNYLLDERLKIGKLRDSEAAITPDRIRYVLNAREETVFGSDYPDHAINIMLHDDLGWKQYVLLGELTFLTY